MLVGHRFSTSMLADRVYVFDRGRVVEEGTHAELMAREGRYARMFLAQAGPYQQGVTGARGFGRKRSVVP